MFVVPSVFIAQGHSRNRSDPSQCTPRMTWGSDAASPLTIIGARPPVAHRQVLPRSLGGCIPRFAVDLLSARCNRQGNGYRAARSDGCIEPGTCRSSRSTPLPLLAFRQALTGHPCGFRRIPMHSSTAITMHVRTLFVVERRVGHDSWCGWSPRQPSRIVGVRCNGPAARVLLFVAAWLEANCSRLRPKTQRSYEQLVRLSVTPLLGRATLEHLTLTMSSAGSGSWRCVGLPRAPCSRPGPCSAASCAMPSATCSSAATRCGSPGRSACRRRT
jgi:hypothetical protein